MDISQILERITKYEATELSPDIWAEIYAYTLAKIQHDIPEETFADLMTLGATIYHLSNNRHAADLQFPVSSSVDEILNYIHKKNERPIH